MYVLCLLNAVGIVEKDKKDTLRQWLYALYIAEISEDSDSLVRERVKKALGRMYGFDDHNNRFEKLIGADKGHPDK